MNHPSINPKISMDRSSMEKEADTKAIGLLSDTHIPSRAGRLPDGVAEVFSQVDLIIHAGDLTSIKVIEELEALAPVLAAHGNKDPPDVKASLPRMGLTEVHGWRIGVIHDVGFPWGMKTMKRTARENNLNILVLGHTHRPFVKWDEGILFINPGSPTNPLPPFITKPTVGLLLVTRQMVKPFIIAV
ncbi:MAG: metallophosphoesterase family protein [Candidatus Bathyarchaeia archaeon]